jgi:outer membrane murein-binding lipoprotein Lpp
MRKTNINPFEVFTRTMSSILFSRGVNTQAGNPVRSELRKLENRIVELEKKLAAMITLGGKAAEDATTAAVAPPAAPASTTAVLTSRPAPGTSTGAILRGR